jgi:hypothetical protein
MKTIVLGISAALLCLALTDVAEAQRGGGRGSPGRSSGMRGNSGSTAGRPRPNPRASDYRPAIDRAWARGRASRNPRAWGRIDRDFGYHPTYDYERLYRPKNHDRRGNNGRRGR